MKKILFWSAVTLFAAVSCNKVENDAPVQESNVPSFVASVDGADTKTVIDGKKSYWDGTEGIRVLDGTLANGKVYTATVEKSQTATFTEVDGSVSLDEDDIEKQINGVVSTARYITVTFLFLLETQLKSFGYLAIRQLERVHMTHLPILQ